MTKRFVSALTSAAILAIAGCDDGLDTDPVKAMAEERTEAALIKDLLREAGSAGDGAGRLRDLGDTRCLIRQSHQLTLEGAALSLEAVFAAPDRACLKTGVVVLTLWRKATTPDGYPELLARDEGPAERFGFGPYFGPHRFVGDVAYPREPNAIDMAQRERAIIEDLKALVDSPPFASRQLPEWRAGELQPRLQGDLTMTPNVDQQTYSAVRSGGHTVLCWKAEETELRCVTQAPKRRPSDLPLFSVHGFDGFRSMTSRVAVGHLLRPPPASS